VDPRKGFVVDFFDVEKCFAGIIGALDHRCLKRVSAVRAYGTADCWAEYQGR
jgi:6-pyruvoyltetrahydropterin/6-carboxytetrahydropterin synthase